jgi:hypothetical protein
MSFILPTPLSDGLERRSRCLVSFDARFGVLQTLRGDAGTLTRTGTHTAVDANGATYTAADAAPLWEAMDIGSGQRDALGLRMDTDDITFPVAPPPQALTWFVEFTPLSGQDGVFYLGNDGQSGARLWIAPSGSNYRLSHNNGSVTRTSTLSAPPGATDRVRLAAQLYDDGSVQLHQSLDEGVVSSASRSSAATLAAAWGTGTTLRLNRVGSAGAQGGCVLRRLKIAAGVLSLAAIDALF